MEKPCHRDLCLMKGEVLFIVCLQLVKKRPSATHVKYYPVPKSLFLLYLIILLTVFAPLFFNF